MVRRTVTSLSIAFEESAESNVVTFEEIVILENWTVSEGMRAMTNKTWFFEGLLRLRHDTMNARAIDMFDFIVGRRFTNVDSIDRDTEGL